MVPPRGLPPAAAGGLAAPAVPRGRPRRARPPPGRGVAAIHAHALQAPPLQHGHRPGRLAVRVQPRRRLCAADDGVAAGAAHSRHAGSQAGGHEPTAAATAAAAVRSTELSPAVSTGSRAAEL